MISSVSNPITFTYQSVDEIYPVSIYGFSRWKKRNNNRNCNQKYPMSTIKSNDNIMQ